MHDAATKKIIFQQLINEHGNHLLRICMVYLKHAQYAEDAVQDAFIKAYRSAKTVEITDPQQQRAWLTRIAINVCKDMLRSSRFRKELLSSQLEAYYTAPSVPQYDLLSVVQALPVKQREAIILYYYQGLCMDEIAKLLHISKTAVHYRLRQAQTALRVQLEGCDDDE